MKKPILILAILILLPLLSACGTGAKKCSQLDGSQKTSCELAAKQEIVIMKLDAREFYK